MTGLAIRAAKGTRQPAADNGTELRYVAYALAERSAGKQQLADVFVGLGVALAASVILIMLYLLPDILRVAVHATGN